MPRMMNRTKKTGIMILLAFSMPLPTPNIRMIMQITKAAVCQKLLPKEEDIEPKAPAKPSISAGARTAPVKVPMVYFKIQPMTTV